MVESLCRHVQLINRLGRCSTEIQTSWKRWTESALGPMGQYGVPIPALYIKIQDIPVVLCCAKRGCRGGDLCVLVHCKDIGIF